MYRIFVFKSYIPKEKYSILNTNSDLMIERYRNEDDMWEMPENMVQEIFAGNENLACDLTCTVSKIDDDNSSFPFIVTFTKPIVDIEQLKQEKLQEAGQLLTEKLQELSDYPAAESASFGTQEKEAVAYLADPEIDQNEIPTITGIAAGAQVELKELARKIVENAENFAPLRGLYLGRHKRVRDMLNQAESLAEVEAVDVQAIFAEEIQNSRENYVK